MRKQLLPYATIRPKLLVSHHLLLPSHPFSTTTSDPTLSSDSESLYLLLRRFHSSPSKLSLALQSSAIPLRPSLVDPVLLRSLHSPSLSFLFFSLSHSHPHLGPPSPSTLRLLLRSLARSRHFDAASSILQHLHLHSPHLLSPDLLLPLIRRFAASRLVSRAVQLLDEIPGGDRRLFDALLDALCKNSNVKEAASLFHEMRDKFAPNLRNFTSLLYGWCRVGKLVEAKQVLVMMKEAEIELDVVVYNVLLAGFAAAGKMEDGYELLREMRRKGCLPNEISYTTLIQGLCSRERMDEAMRLFVEMRRNGCVADAVTFATLLGGFCKSGMVSRGYELLDVMVEQGLRVNAGVYFPIFVAHEKKEQIEECLELMGRMSKDGCVPDQSIYNVVIRLSCKLGEVKQAISLWNEMQTNGFSPDLDSYVIFVNGLASQGSLVEACSYFKEMVSLGLFTRPQYGTLKDLLNSLLRDEKIELAKEVWGCMVKKGCELNVYAWTIWIHALFSRKHVKEACSYCLDMLDSGLMPQPDTFAKLMKGLKKLYNRQIAAEITDKVRKMAEEQHITFKMYKRRGVVDLEQKAKRKAKALRKNNKEKARRGLRRHHLASQPDMQLNSQKE